MYPIRNFNSSIINNFNIDEERKLVLEEAHLLIPDDSTESRKSIINIFLEMPVQERKLLIDQVLELITDDTSDEEKLEIIMRLSSIPPEERQEIMDESSRLIVEDQDSEYKLYIIMILSQVSQEERKSILDCSRKLLIDNTPDENKPGILYSLTKLDPNERKRVVEETLLLFNKDKSPQSISRIFRLLVELPSENRSFLTNQALRLITDTMPAEDRESIIEFLMQIPSEQIECVTTQTLRLSTNSMSYSQIIIIMDFLRNLPLANTESVINQILCLITDRMSSQDIIDLIEFFRRIPLDNIESLITEALRLITDDMDCEDKQRVICYLGSLTTNEREFLIMQALHLSTDAITGEDRVQLIAMVYNNWDSYKFITNSEDVIQDPIKVITNLYETLDRSYIGLLPSFIKYNDNNEVIDDGGVTRAFITTLTNSFCNLDCGLIKNNSGAGGIPTLIEKTDLSIEDQERCFKVIGRFFSAALQGYQSIVLGQYFHPILFEMIHALNKEDFANYNSPQVIDKLLKIWIVKELNASNDCAEALVQNNITDELRDIYCIHSKDEFIYEHQIDKKIKAILLIAESLYNSLLDKREWDTLKGASGDSLRKKIQGTISRDSVRTALQSDERDIVNENSFQFIHKWVAGADPETLEKFIEAISGMKTLSSTMKLNIAGVNGLDKLPEFHTCFFRMDLSHYSSYEAFKEKLEISLDHCFAGSGFQMA